MNAIPQKDEEKLPFGLQLFIWAMTTFFLTVFAYALPGWFCLVLVLCLIVLHEAHHGPGRDWGADW